MMKVILRQFSKGPKPIPKKGSPEFLELQKRLAERKEKVITSPVKKIEEKMSRGFKTSLLASTVPMTCGVGYTLSQDFAVFSLGLAFSGSWIALTGVLLRGAEIGLEAFLYKRPDYQLNKNFIFTGRFRIGTAFLSLPMGLLCIWSCMNYSWVGLSFFFLYQQAGIFATIKTTQENLTPAWLGGAKWMYLLYSQVILAALIYNLISQNPKNINNALDCF